MPRGSWSMSYCVSKRQRMISLGSLMLPYLCHPFTSFAGQFGCCPDGKTPARGSHKEGCPCQYTRYGCCPDGETTALGPRNDGCDDCRYAKFVFRFNYFCCQKYDILLGWRTIFLHNWVYSEFIEDTGKFLGCVQYRVVDSSFQEIGT